MDDLLLLGQDDLIEEFFHDLKSRFTITVEENVGKFVGCELLWNKEERSVLLKQMDIINKIEDQFSDVLTTMKKSKTPSPPGTIIVRSKDGDPMMSADDQSIYQSGVGSLIYLINHSRPDISNAICGLSKVMDKGHYGHMKSLNRVLKYVEQTKEHGVLMKQNMAKNKIWDITCYSDSDWESDPDDRKSIMGWTIFVCGLLVSWG